MPERGRSRKGRRQCDKVQVLLTDQQLVLKSPSFVGQEQDRAEKRAELWDAGLEELSHMLLPGRLQCTLVWWW